jgi:hypothetical protein
LLLEASIHFLPCGGLLRILAGGWVRQTPDNTPSPTHEVNKGRHCAVERRLGGSRARFVITTMGG